MASVSASTKRDQRDGAGREGGDARGLGEVVHGP